LKVLGIYRRFSEDIFLLNFVVSEVFDLDEILPIMKKMVSGCAVGAHFLFVDRNDYETGRKIQKIVEVLQLKTECSEKTKDSMDIDEEKDDLKEISDFLDRQPRIKWNAEWVLAVKQ
jgi:hypothetical protein